MLRQQLSNLSRVTTSTLKYASSSTANLFSWSLQDPGIPSQQLVEFWIAETQRGLVRPFLIIIPSPKFLYRQLLLLLLW